MSRHVHTCCFFFLSYAKTTKDCLHDKTDDEGTNRNEHDGDQDAQALCPKKRRIASVDKAAKISPRQLRNTEDASKDAADNATYAMATESVKGIVVANLSLAERDGEVAYGGNDP